MNPLDLSGLLVAYTSYIIRLPCARLLSNYQCAIFTATFSANSLSFPQTLTPAGDTWAYRGPGPQVMEDPEGWPTRTNSSVMESPITEAFMDSQNVFFRDFGLTEDYRIPHLFGNVKAFCFI